MAVDDMTVARQYIRARGDRTSKQGLEYPMNKVIFEISMSLDGFITASNIRPEEPMGEGGQRLHEWAFGGADDRDRELLAQAVSTEGATIAGRRTYDTSVRWWGADGPTGPARVPVFVVSHDVPDDIPKGGVYTFVTDGIRSDARTTPRCGGGERTVRQAPLAYRCSLSLTMFPMTFPRVGYTPS